MSHAPVHGSWEPAPAARWEDAFLSGNGHHGALVFGDPNDDRVIVTQHTLVRPNGSEHARPPRLAAELPALQDRLLAGDRLAAESFTDGRPLQWVQPFHPAFQIRLSRPADSVRGGYRRAVDFTTGEATAACADWNSRLFVSRADDVIVQEVTAADLVVSLDHRLPGAPAGLGVGHGALLTPEGALLSLRARYPDSDRAYTGVTLVAAFGGTTELVPPGVRVTGARSVLLLTRVRRHTGDLDVVAEGRELRDLLGSGEGRTRISSAATWTATAPPTGGSPSTSAPTRPTAPCPARSCSSARTPPPCWNGSSPPAATTCSPAAACSRPA